MQLFIKTLALAGFLVSASQGKADSLQWLSGENICTGNWSYTKLASCGYADNPNSPIYGTVNDISYEHDSCQNWDSYSVPETTTRQVEWEDSIVAPTSCLALKPNDNSDKDMWVPIGAPFFEGPWNGSCTHRNAFKKCDSWHHVRRQTCTYERRVANTTVSNSCATHQVLTPRQVVTGYNKLVGYDRSCPGAQSQKSDYLASKAGLTDASIDAGSFSCTTLDNAPASTDADIRNKFDAYMNLAFELAAKDGQCPVKNAVGKALSAIANAPGSNGATALTDDQFELVFPTIDSLSAGCETVDLGKKLEGSKASLSAVTGSSNLKVGVNANSDNYSPDSLTFAQGIAPNQFVLFISNRGGDYEIQFAADGSITQIESRFSIKSEKFPAQSAAMSAYLAKLIAQINLDLTTVNKSGPEESKAPLAALVDYLNAFQASYAAAK